MGRESWPGVSVQISRRRFRCVPDPLLCLSQPGAAFVRALTAHAEIWLGPEFLNILDSWPLYHLHPDRLAWPPADARAAEDVPDALRIWSHLRDDAGHIGGPLCWVRDALRESCLPAGVYESIVPRWETLAEALDERLAKASHRHGPVVAAMRDTAALGAVLPGAVVLSLCPRDEPWLPPSLCRHLQAWHVPCRQLDPLGELVTRERNQLLDLMVEAGLQGFLWAGLRLAVVHLVAPGEGRFLPAQAMTRGGEPPDFLADLEPRPVKGAWDDAHAFWYELAAERADAA